MQALNIIKTLTIENHLLTNVINIPSGNFNARPIDTEIDLLVIHCASLPKGDYSNDNLEKLFIGALSSAQLRALGLTADLKVSTHIYINRFGKIYQFVPFDKRAWHAGVSMHNDRSNCNDFSIGIELQGTDDTRFTLMQYEALISVTRVILAYYKKISKNNIVGHSNIAPSRKTDPGSKFDWQFYLNNL